MFVEIGGFDCGGHLVIVYGINLAGFGVAFKEFLGEVFARCQHVHAVQREVGERAELMEEGGEGGKGGVDGGDAGGEGGVVQCGGRGG